MAITKYQEPSTAVDSGTDKHTHSYLNTESQIYTCLSDNVTNSNFRYVFRIKTKDGYLDKVKAPAWTNSLGVSAVNNKLESLYTYSFAPTTSTVTSIGSNRVIQYHLYVEEYYDGVSSPDNATFTKCNVIPVKKNNVNWFEYMMTNTLPGKFLSDFTGDRKIKLTDSATLQCLNGQYKDTLTNRYTSMPYVFHVYEYPTAGVTNTYKIYEYSTTAAQRTAWTNYNSSDSVLQDMTDNMIEIPAGPVNLNAGTRRWIWDVVGGVATAKNQTQTPGLHDDVIDSDTDRYTIRAYRWAGAGVNANVSEIVTYQMESVCPQYAPVRLAWSNYLGGTDYYNFNLKSQKNLNVDRQTFNRTRMDITNTTASYPTYKGGETIHNIEWDEQYVITSDYLEAYESLALESLWTSEDVFAYIGSTWYPIIIENNNITIADYQVDTAHQYQITFRKSNMGFGVQDNTIVNNISLPGATANESGNVIK